MTQEQQAKILTWAGVSRELILRNTISTSEGYKVALEGDFADVVAMKCLRKLGPLYFDLFWDSYLTEDGKAQTGGFWCAREQDDGIEAVADPADAIFAAVLAYLEEK